MNWQKSDNIPEITRDTASLLIVYGTNSPANYLPATEMLTCEELTYSDKLRGEGQKNTWLSCRASLRLILGSYLNKNPSEIEFRKGRFGKLCLPETNLFFNISHSKYAFLLCFSYGGRTGIDIELLNGSEDLPSLVDYAFSDAEAQYCHDGENHERFVKIWTLKEAFLKATGVGLVDELKSINVRNSILHYKLNQQSFICPNNETGSIVYRKTTPLRFIWLI